MKRRLALLMLLNAVPAFADEGLWTFDAIPKDAIEKRYGFRPSDEWIEHVRLASVRVGASGSFVSADGLIVTNHHVALDCIRDISSSSKDFVAKGFLARKPEEELRCPEVEAVQLLGIEDVTASIAKATEGKKGGEADQRSWYDRMTQVGRPG